MAVIFAVGFTPIAGRAVAPMLASANVSVASPAAADCPHETAAFVDQQSQTMLLTKHGNHDRKASTSLTCCSQNLCCALPIACIPPSAVDRVVRLGAFFSKGEPQVRSRAAARLERPPKNA